MEWITYCCQWVQRGATFPCPSKLISDKSFPCPLPTELWFERCVPYCSLCVSNCLFGFFAVLCLSLCSFFLTKASCAVKRGCLDQRLLEFSFCNSLSRDSCFDNWCDFLNLLLHKTIDFFYFILFKRLCLSYLQIWHKGVSLIFMWVDPSVPRVLLYFKG